MTLPHDPMQPIVLDSSVLVGYERVRTAGAAMHETQAWVSGWLLNGIQLIVPAVSLAVASAECHGDLPELEYLIHGEPDSVLVVPLIGSSAVTVGAAVAESGGKEISELEIAHVVWCARGNDEDEGPDFRWPVATYWPSLYEKSGVPLIAL